MLLFVIIYLFPRPISSQRLKCVTGHALDEHTISDLKIAECGNSRDTMCYSRLKQQWWGEINYMYGCGDCFYKTNDTEPRPMPNCKSCEGLLCNMPSTHWDMEVAAEERVTLAPPVQFVPYQEREDFARNEKMAERSLWAVPVAVLVLVVLWAVYIFVRANAEEWYYACLRRCRPRYI